MIFRIITMYRTVVFFVLMFEALAATDEIPRKCYGIHSVMMHCCTGVTTRKITEGKDLKECFENKKPGPPPPFSCEVEECIGKNFGYYGDDGFDKEIFTSFIEKQIENNDALVAAIKEKCINGDISKYGPPDMCDILKMRRCFDNQFLKECPEWSNENECKGFQDIVVQECVLDD